MATEADSHVTPILEEIRFYFSDLRCADGCGHMDHHLFDAFWNQSQEVESYLN